VWQPIQVLLVILALLVYKVTLAKQVQ